MIVSGVKKLNSGLVAAQKGLLFFLMVVLTTAMLAEVVTRYFFGIALFGMEQFVGYTAVWVYFIGAAYGSYERSHIKAEIIGMAIKSKRKLAISRAASAAVATFVSCVLAKWSLDFCLNSIRIHEISPTHSVPMIYFHASLLVGAILMVAYFLWEAIELGRQAYHS
jgi:TRAP-type C4-dicarboxylate transport system permease small subunit